MSFLTYIFRNGLWIAVPIFIGSAVLLVYSILNVIRVRKQAQLLSVPLLEQQEIEFAEAGPVVLCTQSPPLSTRFANLDYELEGEGIPIKGRRVLSVSRTSGLSWVRVQMKNYSIPKPGRYILRITGLEPGALADSEHSIVFVKPHMGQSIAYILGIVFGGLLFIGSILLFFLRLAAKDGSI